MALKFNQVKQVVLKTLGLASLPMKDGKVELSDEHREKLKTIGGEQFPEKFVAQYENAQTGGQENSAAEEEGTDTDATELLSLINGEQSTKLSNLESELNALKDKNEKLQSSLNASQKMVTELSNSPEEDKSLDQAKGGNSKRSKVQFKPNMSYFHNRMADGFLKNDSSLAIVSQSDASFSVGLTASGSGTLNADELKSEFGQYISQVGPIDILRGLTQPTVSIEYMTEKMAIDVWRASKADITHVVQQYVAKWTPLGSASFTPLEIKNRRHKVNLPIVPDDINSSWLSYLYQENMSIQDMPITRYVIEQLLLPKIDDDRELILIGQGVYEELSSSIKDGDTGQATGKSMDGFWTIVKKEKVAGTSKMNFINVNSSASENIVKRVEYFADQVSEKNPLYAKKGMNIFTSPENAKSYAREYRDLYPLTKNADGQKTDVDFTSFKVIGLPSLAGLGEIYLATPKENFVHLTHINKGASKIDIQVQNYEVKVFAEWWEAVGFAVAELVFAYVPAEGSGSGI